MEMKRSPIGPESVIEDLYNNQISSLLDDLHKSISLKEYEHDEKQVYINVTVKNMGYNAVVLNEIKRRYLKEGWGNVFYKLKDGDPTLLIFQLYFPQIKEGIR